jgi:hypothetical protein
VISNIEFARVDTKVIFMLNFREFSMKSTFSSYLFIVLENSGFEDKVTRGSKGKYWACGLVEGSKKSRC